MDPGSNRCWNRGHVVTERVTSDALQMSGGTGYMNNPLLRSVQHAAEKFAREPWKFKTI